LNYLCFGTGAIGTYIGGSLAAAGNRVVFVDTPEVEAIIGKQGLTLDLKSGKVRVESPVIVSSLEKALKQSQFDVGLLAVKSFDTRGFIQQVKPFKSDLPPILCLQNGVENEDLLESALGVGGVIPATVTSAVGKKGPGVISVERLRGVGIFSGHSLSQRILMDFNAAGLKARLFENHMAMKWSKMLTNLLANASSAILNMTPRQVLSSQEGYRLEIRQLREALAVMKAKDIPVVDLPGTPVRGLALLAGKLPEGLGRPLMIQFGARGRGDKMPSLHIDLHARRQQLEVDFLNGAVVRFGKRCGVATPVNDALNQTLIAMAEGRIPLAAYEKRPDLLWRDIFNAPTGRTL